MKQKQTHLKKTVSEELSHSDNLKNRFLVLSFSQQQRGTLKKIFTTRTAILLVHLSTTIWLSFDIFSRIPSYWKTTQSPLTPWQLSTTFESSKRFNKRCHVTQRSFKGCSKRLFCHQESLASEKKKEGKGRKEKERKGKRENDNKDWSAGKWLVQRIPVARIVNGTRLIYAWDFVCSDESG